MIKEMGRVWAGGTVSIAVLLVVVGFLAHFGPVFRLAILAALVAELWLIASIVRAVIHDAEYRWFWWIR
jgi:hypothetical protein